MLFIPTRIPITPTSFPSLSLTDTRSNLTCLGYCWKPEHPGGNPCSYRENVQTPHGDHNWTMIYGAGGSWDYPCGYAMMPHKCYVKVGLQRLITTFSRESEDGPEMLALLDMPRSQISIKTSYCTSQKHKETRVTPTKKALGAILKFYQFSDAVKWWEWRVPGMRRKTEVRVVWPQLLFTTALQASTSIDASFKLLHWID